MKTIAIIPARGGSKGLKNKNILQLNGKPMIAYTIEAAFKSTVPDEVIVSTDSEQILNIAKQYGVDSPLRRPTHLAEDTTSTIEVIQHVIAERYANESVNVILLQPTSPLRTARHIQEAYQIYLERGIPVLSISEADTHPILMREIKNGFIVPFLPASSLNRRQDYPPYYQLNGAIYITDSSYIKAGRLYKDLSAPYVMDKESSIDIDDIYDFMLASYVMEKRGEKNDKYRPEDHL
ncbi:cytidylyltransferase domain-containing protein [Falsibacillus pallidus]|uniref:N-acylneuraminate cytidylyltransferase n=1 Tax=Falsibacillus pallidus TaxID=493781 RepID=A0A370GWU0_9BACI|nr:acylneuraminate cytidylyltransferase family protein [Falsibacillus pallidus]RDI47720.1 N-acylneuraminate cytidylyltransferase [Falsibacillus pallidus]